MMINGKIKDIYFLKPSFETDNSKVIKVKEKNLVKFVVGTFGEIEKISDNNFFIINEYFDYLVEKEEFKLMLFDEFDFLNMFFDDLKNIIYCKSFITWFKKRNCFGNDELKDVMGWGEEEIKYVEKTCDVSYEYVDYKNVDLMNEAEKEDKNEVLMVREFYVDEVSLDDNQCCLFVKKTKWNDPEKFVKEELFEFVLDNSELKNRLYKIETENSVEYSTFKDEKKKRKNYEKEIEKLITDIKENYKVFVRYNSVSCFVSMVEKNVDFDEFKKKLEENKNKEEK